MKYLGIARAEKGRIVMPDGFDEHAGGQTYEAVEIGGTVILAPAPLNRERLAQVDRLARRSIEDHRGALDGLAG